MNILRLKSTALNVKLLALVCVFIPLLGGCPNGCTNPEDDLVPVDLDRSGDESDKTFREATELEQSQRPVIESFTPTSGVRTRSHRVTITGRNFTAGSRVSLGYTVCTNVRVDSSTTISFDTPISYFARDQPIKVSAADGAFVTSSTLFRSIDPASIRRIGDVLQMFNGDLQISIIGANFRPGVSVSVGGIPCNINLQDDGIIRCAGALGALSGYLDVIVRNPGEDTVTAQVFAPRVRVDPPQVAAPAQNPGNPFAAANFGLGALWGQQNRPQAFLIPPAILNPPFLADGYNLHGFDDQGFNRNGFHWSGNFTYFGHAVRALEHGTTNIGTASESLTVYTHAQLENGEDGSVNAMRFASAILPNNAPADAIKWGFNQAGFRRALPYSNLVANDAASQLQHRYDRDGYNPAHKNFLGISRTAFEAHSFDAVMTENLVPENGDALIALFNTQCWQLYDHIVNLDNITSFDDLATSIRANPDTATMTNDQIAGYLKKTIALYRFIKNSRLATPAGAGAVNPLATPIADFKIPRDYRLSDTIRRINYESLLREQQAARAINVRTEIMNRLNRPEVLAPARYEESYDQNAYGANLNTKRQHLNNVFDAYEYGSGAPQGFYLDKGRYELYRIAETIATADDLTLSGTVIPKLLHAGLHCKDAKRKAVNDIYTVLRNDVREAMDKKERDIQGAGLHSNLVMFNYALKSGKLSSWISEEITRQNNPEMASTYAGEWDVWATQMGLHKVDGHNYHLLIRPNLDDFFRPRSEMRTIFPGSVISGGDYSATEIYKAFMLDEIYNKLNDNIIGPLANCSQENPSAALGGLSWIKGLLARFGMIEHPTIAGVV